MDHLSLRNDLLAAPVVTAAMMAACLESEVAPGYEFWLDGGGGMHFRWLARVSVRLLPAPPFLNDR